MTPPFKPSSFLAQPTATPVLTVHANYASGDYVGTSGTAMVFANCAAYPGLRGYVVSAVLVDAEVQSKAGELWLFDTAITPPADSAAWSISDADAAHLVTIIPFTTYYASALNSVSIGIPAGAGQFVSATGNLYGCFITKDASGAPTYVSGCLTFKLTTVMEID